MSSPAHHFESRYKLRTRSAAKQTATMAAERVNAARPTAYDD